MWRGQVFSGEESPSDLAGELGHPLRVPPLVVIPRVNLPKNKFKKVIKREKQDARGASERSRGTSVWGRAKSSRAAQGPHHKREGTENDLSCPDLRSLVLMWVLFASRRRPADG